MSEMTLAEAIRLGAMMKPQCFGRLHKDGGSCALGAALDAIGDSGPLHARWPVLSNVVPHPVTGTGCWNVDCLITNLNDEHRWTREQIADWVQTIESPEPPITAAEVHAAIQAEAHK